MTTPAEAPPRSVRVSDELWAAVRAIADRERRTASDIVRRALEAAVDGEDDAA